MTTDTNRHMEHQPIKYLDGNEVFPYGHSPEDRGFLGKISDSLAGPKIHRQGGDVVSVQEYPAGIGGDKTQNTMKGGGFSRPVRAQESDDFPRFKEQGKVTNYLPSAVGLRQPFSG